MTSDLHQSVVDQVRARIGTTLAGRWHLDAVLGMGGMAAVYAATSPDGQRAAIKILHAALSMNESVRKRFTREARVANTIGHPGVVRVLDDGVAEDGAAFLVMELLEGETVAERAVRLGGKLPVHEVAYIGEVVADVLAAAHASRVIHRDVKPENIFITQDGRVVVLDFGIARVSNALGMTDSQTRTGTMMGTPAFMPPEQARGRANEMDATSDVWALGATLFWLASGRVVPEAETPNEQLVAAATLPAPSLGRVARQVPAPLVTVIDRALEFAKENRFKDAVAMKDALHAAVTAIAWGPGAAPSLGEPAAADTIPPPPVQSSTTLSEASKLGVPTIGPVEVGGQPTGRGRLVRALVAGGLSFAAVIGIVVLVARHDSKTAPAVPAPPPPVADTSQRPVEPVVHATAPAPPALTATAPAVSASTSASTQRPHAAQHAPRSNWLDRRN